MTALYTVRETAKLLRVNTTKVYKFINNNELRACKIGQIKVTDTALLDFIATQEAKTTTIVDKM